MSKPFTAASADAVVFCADIGGSFIKFGISARSGEVEEFGKVPTPTASWDDFVAAVQGLINQYAPGYPADTPLAISTAGLVSPQTGELLATNIPAFTGRSLAADLSLALQRPVSAANDADCFALAEAYAGNAQNQPIVAGIILGTGVGGGLVINGQLVRGHGGVTGEWGHGAITRTELLINGKSYHIPRLPCACGQHGCLDILGGARGLERLHQHLNQQERTSQQIVDGWQNGQPDSDLTIQAWLQLVAEPLALLANILGPSKIVVGGGLANAIPLITALDLAVRNGVLHRYPEPLVVTGKFAGAGGNGGMIGASVLGRLSERPAL
ncbi:ROK family protein [Ewingella americana]|uniref:N-acetyl-D-glucosamine kinase n=2 Tax=Ewingella americana TaxID=41202 RepID=A0A085GJ40_EWIA3|nr:ROK family protein [Ewingella americana]KAA8729242.1 ROK family protein [Ewingella americana]KFC83735.1 N-acetylmannosamine kinase [Ewingella americana ATCC 33852]STQ45357.1 N-acetyl-D-glucosamine kinase [Ewingella americana]